MKAPGPPYGETRKRRYVSTLAISGLGGLNNCPDCVSDAITTAGPTQQSGAIRVLFATEEFTPRKQFSPMSQKPEITTWDETKTLFLTRE